MICYIHPYVLSYFSRVLPSTSIVPQCPTPSDIITIPSIEWDPGLFSHCTTLVEPFILKPTTEVDRPLVNKLEHLFLCINSKMLGLFHIIS